MYAATLRFPGQPDARVLAMALEALAVSNAFWTMSEWQAGVDPPCCLECAGVAWRPDQPGADPTFDGAPDVLRKKVASCGPIAAYECGRKLAEAMRDGASLEDALGDYGIVLLDAEGQPYGVGGMPRSIGALEPIVGASTTRSRAAAMRGYVFDQPSAAASGSGYGSSNLRQSDSPARRATAARDRGGSNGYAPPASRGAPVSLSDSRGGTRRGDPRQGYPIVGGRSAYWHAVVRTPKGLWDPTKEMARR